MKSIKRILPRTLILMALLLTFTAVNKLSFADVGSFEDYSSGDSSWSSSSSDWGSSSSSSWDWGSDYDSDFSSGGISDDFEAFIIFIIIIFIFTIGYIYYSHKQPNMVRRPTKSKYNSENPRVTYDNTGIPTRIKQIDPNFSRVEFESFAKEVFIKLQNAWTDRDWEKIRPFESKELFEQHKMQLDGYIKNNQINVMDRICVNDINFVSFEQSSEKDTLVIDLDSRMSDYIIDATTKEVIKGNKETEYYHTYTLTFTRTKGMVTESNITALNTTNCPNCGAPTTITSAGRCEYCNSIIVTNNHGWVLASLNRRN